MPMNRRLRMPCCGQLFRSVSETLSFAKDLTCYCPRPRSGKSTRPPGWRRARSDGIRPRGKVWYDWPAQPSGTCRRDSDLGECPLWPDGAHVAARARRGPYPTRSAWMARELTKLARCLLKAPRLALQVLRRSEYVLARSEMGPSCTAVQAFRAASGRHTTCFTPTSARWQQFPLRQRAVASAPVVSLTATRVSPLCWPRKQGADISPAAFVFFFWKRRMCSPVEQRLHARPSGAARLSERKNPQAAVGG